MASLASQYDDSFLQNALSAVGLPRGSWSDLFLERCTTSRMDWDLSGGVRVTSGVREGFALRRVESGRQRIVSEEGLSHERIDKACRGDGSLDAAPADREPPDDSPATDALPGGFLEDLGRDLAAAVATDGCLSLRVEQLRRETGVALGAGSVHRNCITRVVLACRLDRSIGAFSTGLGAGSLEALLAKDPGRRFHRDLEEALQDGREARDAPEGEFPVVFAPGTGGVFFHEACGHALEADQVLRGTTPFRDLLGCRIAPERVGAMDDSSQPGLEGSYEWDDEGLACRGTVLIARGILKAFLADRITGEKLGRGSTANGRRESFRDAPLPRMSNAFLMAGDEDPQEILRGTTKGIYVARLDGGRTDPATGEFLFRASRGSLIEEGRLTSPLRPFTLSGSGPAALRSIECVGSDLSFGDGAGSCGKEGQRVPVAAGLPTVRLTALAVRPG
ncbi:MAG TPA: TldD/PmbA family protein [Candidatus Polarisedimenticolia bacterium]|jgi:TldD protein|nr:TldD/PmbA family protein [Candidatus Polarisedimenticolia bacterium]